MYDNDTTPFDRATQNLCLGDSLLFVFYTPHNCDTIVNVNWLQNNGRLYHQDDHVRSFVVKPTQGGDNTYRVRIFYKHPNETINLTFDFQYVVTVKQRPHLFINYPNPPDTIKYCYPDEAPLNLNLPNPTDNIIDYNFVVDGPNTVNFLKSKGVGVDVDTLSSFSPDKTGNYVVIANYKYLCSEMPSTLARGEVRIVVNNNSEDPASFIVTPPKEGFCVVEGITIKSSDKEGSSLAWEHNGTLIEHFPYNPDTGPGTYTLTTLIYNACHAEGNPKRYDIEVRLVPKPIIEAMPDRTVCRGDSVVLKYVPGRFVGDTLIWTFTSGVITKDTVVINNTTTFRANSGNVCGYVSDDVTIYRMPDAAVQLMPDTAACLYDEIRLRVLQKEGDIIWRNSHFNLIGTGDVVPVWVSGNETYTAIAANQCSSDSADLRVTSLYLPNVELKADTSICYGTPLDLQERVFDSWGILQWTPSQNASPTEAGTYVATASTEKCGSASDTIFVNVYPPLMLLPDNSQLPHYNQQDFYEASFQTLQGEPALSYSINGTLPPGLAPVNGRISGKPVLGPYDYNTHLLEVSVVDSHQCQTSKEYVLKPEWKAANVLLPTADAENAVFLPEYSLEVYNRNGLLLHKGMGWNGIWNNAYVPAGTYFYKVKILIDNMPEDRMSYVVVMYY
jgi:hypothetical protein